MIVKIHKATRYVVAVCDEDLVGKKFFDEDNVRQIDMTSQFFKGELKNEDETIELMADMKKEDAIFNIVGEKSTAVALKAKIISEEGITKIAGIPIALALL